MITTVLNLVSVCSPKLTERPNPPLNGWEEKTIHSKEHDIEYRYLEYPSPHEDAPVILFIHGALIDSRMWINMSGLADDLRLIALDWHSDDPFFTGKMEDMRYSIIDFLKPMQITSVNVISVSAGTYRAIEFIVNPEGINIDSFVIINSPMAGVNEEEDKRRLKYAKRGLRVKPKTVQRFFEKRIIRWYKDMEPVDGLTLLDVYYTRPPIYFTQFFTLIVNHELKRQPLEKISCPVLVLQAGSDELFPPDTARLTSKYIKNCEYIEFDGLNHTMVFTHGPLLIEKLKQFYLKHEIVVDEN